MHSELGDYLKFNIQLLLLEHFHVMLLSTSQREILYFPLHYIYLTALISFQMQI